MRDFDTALPIDETLGRLTAHLRERTAAVLVAPPGAGKTTRVPLVLIDEPWAAAGKILVLEPRRLAARAAAARMAATLGERVGETVGLRVRFGSKVSRKTRVEVVTEGIFTRLILDDPELDGVAAVLFDEFHERSLDADLGLALARDAQQGLREDLRLLVMSATLDGARVGKLLGDAPLIESEGRSFPVETRYAGRDPREPIERQVADAAVRALRAEAGSILAFLPGAGEIRRAERLLRERVDDPAVDIVPLYGALDRDVQDRAIAPSRGGTRKIVLATSIAETSITIEGVRIVIDSGLARVPRYEPDLGFTALETVRVSRAAADQRRGRAGRTEPGICIRLWDEAQTASLPAFAAPEILSADLSSFVLDLAQWGVTEPGALAFLDPPPKPALTEARALLRELGGLDADGRITPEGRALRDLPLPPRLARMVITAAARDEGERAGLLAALLSERGLGGDDIDLEHRLDGLRRDRSPRGQEARRMARGWVERVRHSAATKNIGAVAGDGDERADTAQSARSDVSVSGASARRAGDQSLGALLALAYPDRVARNRGGEGGSFLLANGRGAQLDLASPLAREPFLAVAELAGSAGRSRIVSAARITLAEIEEQFADAIKSSDTVVFDPASGNLRGRRRRLLGSLTLSEGPFAVAPGEEATRALVAGVVQSGIGKLPWTPAIRQWRDRVTFLRKAGGAPWPDLSDAALAETAEAWLAPMLSGKTALSQLSAGEFASGLETLVDWSLRRRVDAEAPTHFEAPTGSRIAIDYDHPEGPKIAVRVQELFGLARHPSIAGGRVPLVVELLSPAHRLVQVTRDLPGFWRGSYAAVRTEMRGRYPRHPWPDDPLEAPPTRRAKPRGT
ncbi:MAG: ATP-dependent helicase HrpB [Variibacter sp.]